MTDVDLSYEDLCNFIYIREELSEKLQLLSDSLHDFDRKQTLDMGTLIAQMEKALQLKHRQIQGMMLSRKTSMDNLLGCHYPQCFICRREFVHCSHLCAHCRVQLDEMDNSPCPACNRGSHLSARKVAGAGFSFVLDNAEKLDLGELEEDGVPHDFLPLYTNEKARVMRKLQAQQRCLDDFTTWFCDTHSAFQSHLITARNSINLFITSFVMHLSPANGQMPDVYRRMVIECLHELIYPAIHDSLLGLYRKQVMTPPHCLGLIPILRRLSSRRKTMRSRLFAHFSQTGILFTSRQRSSGPLRTLRGLPSRFKLSEASEASIRLWQSSMPCFMR